MSWAKKRKKRLIRLQVFPHRSFLTGIIIPVRKFLQGLICRSPLAGLPGAFLFCGAAERQDTEAYMTAGGRGATPALVQQAPRRLTHYG